MTLSSVVAEMRDASSIRGLSRALEIAGIVIRSLYGGDISRWRARGRRDPVFRRLVAAPGLPVSERTLRRFMQVYDLCDRIDVSRCKHLELRHCYAVLHLPRGEQEMALVAASRGRWPAKTLESKTRRRRKRRSSRPPS